MARITRAEVFNPREISVFHCLNRCVRRCFLCGRDRLTGQDVAPRPSTMTRPAAPASDDSRRTPADWLAPLPLDEHGAAGAIPGQFGRRASDMGFLPLPLDDYLDL